MDGSASTLRNREVHYPTFSPTNQPPPPHGSTGAISTAQVAVASDVPRARDDTSIVARHDTDAVARRARSLSPIRDEDAGASLKLSSLRMDMSSAEKKDFGTAEWSFQLETACEEKDQNERRVDRNSPGGSPFSTPTRHRSPSLGGTGIRRSTSIDVLRRGSAHFRQKSTDMLTYGESQHTK